MITSFFGKSDDEATIAFKDQTPVNEKTYVTVSLPKNVTQIKKKLIEIT